MGSVNIDNTGSGADVTLSSDGTDLLLDGTAIGGTALELYAENPSSPTAPSATGSNAVAIGSGAVSSGDRSIALGNLANATSLRAFAAGVNATSSNFNAIAMGPNSAASGNASVAIGDAAISVNTSAVALGTAYASGTDSFAAAITNSTGTYGATGANSIAMGSQAKATGSDAVAIGDTNIASGVASFASGTQTEASAIYARSGGYLSVANVSGDAWASGNFATAGDAQNVKLVIRGATSNTTPVVLTTSGGDTGRSLLLETNSAYAFSLMVVARRDASDGTESAAVKIEGLIRKESNDASITLVNSNKTTISNAPSWTIAAAANDGSGSAYGGGLDVVCADFVNGHNIRWVGTLKYTKVTYA